MTAPMTVEPGRVVRVAYSLHDHDGCALDGLPLGEPAEVLIGAGALPPLLEAAILGMTAGSVRRVPLPAHQALPPLERRTVPLTPEQRAPLAVGQPLRLPDGAEGIITHLTEDAAQLLTGSLLADLDLVADVIILTVRESTAEEQAVGLPLIPELREPWRVRFYLNEDWPA